MVAAPIISSVCVGAFQWFQNTYFPKYPSATLLDATLTTNPKHGCFIELIIIFQWKDINGNFWL